MEDFVFAWNPPSFLAMNFTQLPARFALKMEGSANQSAPVFQKIYLRQPKKDFSMKIDHRFFAVIWTVALFASFCKNEPKTATTQVGSANPTIAELTALLEKSPDNDSLLFRRSEAFYEEGSYDPALEDIMRAIEIDSMRAPYFHLWADIFLDYYKSAAALKVMEAAAIRFPERIPTLLKLSEFQLILKQRSEALSTIDKIFRLDPQNAEGWFMTGQICKDMGETDRAIASYKKAIAIDPDNRDSYLSLGQLFTAKRDKLALQYFGNALRIDSSSLETRHAMATYFEKTGDLNRAKTIYREIINLDGSYAEAYFNTGLLLLDQDSVEKARDHFDLTLKTDPLFIKAFYFRGVAEEKLGQKKEALADYDQALRMAPGYKEADVAFRRLSKTN